MHVGPHMRVYVHVCVEYHYLLLNKATIKDLTSKFLGFKQCSSDADVCSQSHE